MKVENLLITALIAVSSATASPVGTISREAIAPEKKVSVGAVTLAVRDLGPRAGPVVILIPGTGMQMIEWPDTLVKGLLRRRRRVILFDNRDAGGSTHFTSAGLPDFAALAKGNSRLPYSASDMANDVVGLARQLKIARADVIGISGGATLAQIVALEKPEFVRSLIVVAVNSGDPAIPLPADPARMRAVPPPKQGTLSELIDARVATTRALAGRGYPFDEKAARSMAKKVLARDRDAFGAIRQGVALIILGDLRQRQANITVPTTVIHGTDDPLLSIKGAEEVAKIIPGATWVPIVGMGHDLPPAAIGRILAAINGGPRQ